MLILDDDDDDDDYDDALVCRRQVALGGYRLKHTLEEVLHTHTHTLSLFLFLFHILHISTRLYCIIYSLFCINYTFYVGGCCDTILYTHIY